MNSKKKYKKQLLKSLKNLAFSEHHLLETMTNLMLLKEAKKNNIEFKKGDTFLSKIISSIIVMTKTSEKLLNFAKKC